MSLLNLFKRNKNLQTKKEETVCTEVLNNGLLIFFKDKNTVNSLESLLSDYSPVDKNEVILRSFLSQLLIEEKCELTKEGILLSWHVFFEMANDPDFKGLFELFNTPQISSFKPIISNNGILSDQVFKLEVIGWIEDGRKITVDVKKLPLVEMNGQNFFVDYLVFQTLVEINLLNSLNIKDRSQFAHEKHWGIIRQHADKAGVFYASEYLKNSHVMTLKNLRLPTHVSNTNFGKVTTVEPTFHDAPNGWLRAYDSFNKVQEHYDFIDNQKRVRVVVSEPVKKVLEVIKNEMPTRKVAGSKAEKFLRNPKAFLGDLATDVINDKEFIEDRIHSGFEISSFLFKPILINGLISYVNFNINTFNANNSSSSYTKKINSANDLDLIIQKINEAIGLDREYVSFENFELAINSDSKYEIKKVFQTCNIWRCQNSDFISYDDIYEFDDYSERVIGIGVEKPMYVPALQNVKSNNPEDKWIPDSLEPILRVYVPGTSEAVRISVTREWLQKFDEKIKIAKDNGAAEITDSLLPCPIQIQHAIELASNFNDLIKAASRTTDPTKSNTTSKNSKENEKKERLLVKKNFSKVDYLEERYEELKLKPNQNAILPITLNPNIKLKSHQLLGVAWFQNLYSRAPVEVRGALLADDMGLGKTLQLLCFLGSLFESNPDTDPALIVVPKTLLVNWASEVSKFFNNDFPKVLTLYGEELEVAKQPINMIHELLKKKNINNLFIPNWIGNSKIILTTYEVLLNFEFSFAMQDFSVVICDEAQKIKNPTAQITMAVKKLKSNFRIACTGTPVENSLFDLWCLFDFIQPGLLDSLENFSKNFRQPIEHGDEGSNSALQKLQLLIKPQTLRRTKVDIAAELPKKYFAISKNDCNDIVYKEKIELTDLLKIEMSDFQRECYKTGLKKLLDARAEVNGKKRLGLSFDALHFIKAVCSEPYCLPGKKFKVDQNGDEFHLRNSSKLSWLLRQLTEIRKKGEKAIVFTEIRQVQCALHYFFKKQFDLTALIINGDSSQRQKLIDDFSAKMGFNVIILSPLAAGAGLNIVSANHVFHFTRTWNPAKEAQSTDRAYRIGQTKDVMVYCPTSVDSADKLYTTFDQRLDRLIKQKTELSNSTLHEDSLVNMFSAPHSIIGISDFLINDGLAVHNVPTRNLTIDDIDRLDGDSFEAFCSFMLSKDGYSSTITNKARGDGGIDIVALGENYSGFLVQCKCSSRSGLGWDAVKEVVAGAPAYELRLPLYSLAKLAITNQTFNTTAKTQAEINNVRLYDRDKIVEWVSKYQITVHDLDRLLQ